MDLICMCLVVSVLLACALPLRCLHPVGGHDPTRPEDVLKIDVDEDGVGGDDPADCLRYLVATKSRSISQRKLRGCDYFGAATTLVRSRSSRARRDSRATDTISSHSLA